MKDLDFDELDKAVNSLMANSQKEPDATPAPSLPQPPSAVPPPQSVPVIAAASPPRPAPPAARRGGRFMDVVHPGVKKEAAPRVSRQAPTLQPTTPSFAATTVQTEPTVVKDVEPVSSVTESSKASATSDWPDPLELATKSSADELGKPDVEISTPAVVDTPAPSDEQPLSSPFLPDAKVEKRPLGSATTVDESASALMVEDENAQLPALPKDVEPALPEELHGDVASIEADNSTTDPSKHLSGSQASASSSSAKKDVETAKVEQPKPAVAVAAAPVPTGPTSIPQQYKEEPNSGDQQSGAIYDTDSYHQPLSHPSKKKSGWSWVIWIILILLIGAAGGAALYLLGIVK